TGKASAYTYGDGNKTATGKGVRPGYVAVNPKIIPYGTKLFIRTPDGKYMYGYASAEDTGGFIYWSNPRVVDLFFTSESACRTFGVRNIEIYVL
ncbi:MAG: 3D domain-containing protein, partial [Clostridia bacterium]|nr:3D domain-containing protein [Clostridia bacterium]